MKSRTTIKDIANAGGVSIGTVHLALSGKSGVGEKTREKIRALAQEMNYHPNTVAASLKRKTLNIASCFPETTGDNRLYYPQLWNGLRAYMDSLQDYNITCREFAYPENRKSGEQQEAKEESLSELTVLLEQGELDGLVISGNCCPYSEKDLRRYTERGLHLALVDTDMPHSGRLCCVAADYDSIGRTMAELVLGRIPSCGSIVMCAGREEYPSHRRIEEGFASYMREHGHSNLVYKENSNQITEEAYQDILKQIQKPDVAAACCVSSRSSLMMGRALEASGRAGTLVTVGSDLFEENKDYLRRGIFHNLIQKNPYAQAFMAVKFLTDYLLKDIVPEELFTVGCQIIFRSNLPLYERNSVRFLE